MTIKQKQCLLQYLGYYSITVDGLWGAASITATKAFQKDNSLTQDGIIGGQTEKALIDAVHNGRFAKTDSTVTNPADKTDNPTNTPTKAETTGTFWDNVKYFKRSEFACKCGGKYCNGYPAEPKEKLIMVAENVREHFGKAMPVSSGLRCTRHNANVGGVSNSRHLSGKAMDFCVSGVSAATVLSYVKQQKDIRYAYAIDGSYVHMDIE